MTYFLELLVNGLSLGLVYGLVAIGFVIVFKATNVLNFAHGSLVLLGSYVVAVSHAAVGFLPAVLLGLGATVAAAVLIHLLVIRPAGNAEGGTFAILTIGVDILLITELTQLIGNDVLTTGTPWGAAVLEVSGIRIPTTRAIAAAVALVLLVALAVAFRTSSAGIAVRAAAADPDTAALMGVRLHRVGAAAWGLAGALAAVAGIFLTAFPSAGVTPSVALVALSAIPAWVLGGFDSIPGAVVGGLIVGASSALVAGYQGDLAFLGRGLGEVTPWVVMLLVLLIRPQGLFGTIEATRV